MCSLLVALTRALDSDSLSLPARIFSPFCRFFLPKGLALLRLLLLRQLALLIKSATLVLIRRKHRRLINCQDFSHDYTHFPKHDEPRLLLLILQLKQTLGVPIY